MKKAAFHTLGCKVNQYETEAVAELFKQHGYEIVDFNEAADVYVINTCTVTNLGDRKSGQMIRRTKKHNEDAIVVVMGCYAQTAAEEVSRIPGVNIVIGTKDRHKILDLVDQLQGNSQKITQVDNIMNQKDFEELEVSTYRDRTRAFIKIQEGCNQFCSYCIIPYARGPIRSRKPESVINEVRKFAENGYREVVLTGIHVASYGKDLGDLGLVDIIGMVHKIEGIDRIRLSSIEPTIIDDRFVSAAKEFTKLCPHYHVSLQSGCDSTLKRMNRKYSVQDYRKVIERLRTGIKDVSVTTDIMVGFPGETKDEFEETYRFLDEISFSKMHIFKYSPRKGTPASKYPGQVSSEEKDERSRRLFELDAIKQNEFRKMFLGREMDVLYEEDSKARTGYIEGFTGNYINVIAKGGKEDKRNILRTKIVEIECDYGIGEIIR